MKIQHLEERIQDYKDSIEKVVEKKFIGKLQLKKS